MRNHDPRLVGEPSPDLGIDAENRDHQVIGTGKIDFAMVSKFWRPEHHLVIELNPRVSVDGVRASKAWIEDLLD